MSLSNRLNGADRIWIIIGIVAVIVVVIMSIIGIG